MSIPVPTISAAGITISDYATILTAYQNEYLSIYGFDTVLDVDDLDLQYIAVEAQAHFDLCQVIQDIYNQFSPLNSSGPFLANMLALDGITPPTPTNSTCVVTVIGQAYTPLTNCSVGDNLNLGTVWDLPASVIIPSGGTINVTATCTQLGAVNVAADTLTIMLTPTAGWQSVNNYVASVPGVAISTGPALRELQQQTIAASSEGYMVSVAGAVAALNGVTQVSYDNNNTSSVDANGVPARSVAVVVEGGDVTEIATAISQTMPPGIPTYGTTSVTVVDANGVPDTVNFYVVNRQRIQVKVVYETLPGFVPATGLVIQQAVYNFVNSLPMGTSSYLQWLSTPANSGGQTVKVTAITQCLYGESLAASDLTATLNEQFWCNLADVVVGTS